MFGRKDKEVIREVIKEVISANYAGGTQISIGAGTGINFSVIAKDAETALDLILKVMAKVRFEPSKGLAVM